MSIPYHAPSDGIHRIWAIINEGKQYATIAIGCTGGRHRSVAIAEELASRLRSDGIEVVLSHRDKDRE